MGRCHIGNVESGYKPTKRTEPTITVGRIDTSITRRYRQSPGKTSLLLLSSLVFVAGGLFGTINLDPTRDLGAYISYLTLAFFGPCAVAILIRFITLRGDVLFISPDGIRDRRLAPETIPWTAILGISTFAYQGQRILILHLDPEVEAQLRLPLLSRLTRRANAAIGLNGLCVATVGLDITFDQLLSVTRAYMKTAAEVAYGVP